MTTQTTTKTTIPTPRHEITLEDCKGYATEANLRRALTRLGLDEWEGESRHGPVTLRYMVARKPDGQWTAIFLVSEFLNHCGGYVGMASQHGFMSV